MLQFDLDSMQWRFVIKSPYTVLIEHVDILSDS